MRRPVPVIQVSGDVGADRHQVKTEADQHDTLVRKEGMWEGRKVGRKADIRRKAIYCGFWSIQPF